MWEWKLPRISRDDGGVQLERAAIAMILTAAVLILRLWQNWQWPISRQFGGV